MNRFKIPANIIIVALMILLASQPARIGKAWTAGDIQKIVIDGPPHPPAGYENERAPSALPQTDQASGIVTLNVPTYDWVFGCSAVSGAMIAAYYDRNGMPNMYTGPTNSGLMPMDSSSWPTWSDGVDLYPNNPLVASHNGLDGRTTRGSIDNYWVQYLSADQDPYIANGWPQHTWGDAIGDYMKTSQSAYDNTDGSTSFYYSNYGQLTCSEMESAGIASMDGTYGQKLFYEARGYTVTDCFSEKTDNNLGGFTFSRYMAEIDAGKPVMLHLEGHTVVGVGYDSSSNTVYINDTWDFNTHTMTWGGSYSGMALEMVSIVHPNSPNPPGSFSKSSPADGATGVSPSPTLSWGVSSGAAGYEYCYDTTDDDACSIWTGNGSNTSVTLSGLSANTKYYWQARANNANGTTYANGSEAAFWSFTTGSGGPPPGSFNKSGPPDGATGVSVSPTLSWGVSSAATRYEYCYDVIDDDNCLGWVNNSASTSVSLSGLFSNTTYYWHVRAVNAYGTTYANGSNTAFWSFTTGSGETPPGSFSKSGPFDGATDVTTSPKLSWQPSSGATGYDYCYDTTDDGACSSWVNNGAKTSVVLSGLSGSTAYYWHVRAVNAAGITYSNGSDTAFWSFTTVAVGPATHDLFLPLIINLGNPGS